MQSFGALRHAHLTLLRQHRDSPVTPKEILAFIDRGRAVGVMLDQEKEREAAQQILDYWSTQILRSGEQSPDATLAPFQPELAPTLDDALCPYRGLHAFHEVHHDFFFGRERLLDELRQILLAHRLLCVVGPSGCGKSSLVMGGLLPALRAAPPAEGGGWRYLPRVLPGSAPMRQLARLLLGLGPPVPPAEQEEQLRREEAALRADGGYLARKLDQVCDAPPLLLVDQFEEIFTLAVDADRQAFVASLLGLLQVPGRRRYLVLTLRSDFETYVARLRALWPLFTAAQFRVPPMSAVELRQAIEGPARRIGLHFEEGVVDELIGQVLGEPAALPLLQFSLLKLWENREHNRITHDAFRKCGGGQLALERAADTLYDSLIPELQVTLRRLLLELVQPGDGLEVTSNRVSLSTLHRLGEPLERIDGVLQRLVQANLVRFTKGEGPDDTLLEVAHEALVRNWRRLLAWLDEERDVLRKRREVTRAALRWDNLQRAPGALWRPPLFYPDLLKLNLQPLDREFLVASQEAVDAEERSRELARQRELDQARERAEEERRRAESQRLAARRYGVLSVVLGVLLVGVAISLGLLVQAMRERTRAEAESRAAAERAGKALIAAEKERQRVLAAEAAQKAEANKGAQASELATLVARGDDVGAIRKLAADEQLLAREWALFNTLCLKLLRQPGGAAVRDLCLNQARPLMVQLPAGEFQMGGVIAEVPRRSMPHRVQITHPFAISATEITLGLFRRIMKDDPSKRTGEDKLPCASGTVDALSAVSCVTFYEAATFANKLSELDGLTPCYEVRRQNETVTWLGGFACPGYRLPTDAEWEYAARAGGNTRHAGSDDLQKVAWKWEETQHIKPVALKAPNALGIFDLNGNVKEWVWDYFADLPAKDDVDPLGPLRGVNRVLRGASIQDGTSRFLLAYRGFGHPTYFSSVIGIRLARTLVPASNQKRSSSKN